MTEVYVPAAMNLVCLAAVMTILVFYVSGDSANRLIQELVDGAVRDFSLTSALVFPVANDVTRLASLPAVWSRSVDQERGRLAPEAKRSAERRKRSNTRLQLSSWVLVLALTVTVLLPILWYAIVVHRTLSASGALTSLAVTMLLFGTEFAFFFFVVRRWVVLRRRELYISFTEAFLKAQAYGLPEYCGSKAATDSSRNAQLLNLLENGLDRIRPPSPPESS